jgi:hypothetical protein
MMNQNAVLIAVLSSLLMISLPGCSEQSNEARTGPTEQSSAASTSDQGFRPLFDGETLEGWKRHENLPGEQNQGGKWEVVDGAIVGDQDPPGRGGFLITTDEYEDFVLKLESKLDYPVDSGIFLRVGEKGKSHQITLDYRPDGTVGAVHMALLRGFVHKVNAKEKFGRDEWNDLKVRTEGHPAHIQFWLNGEKITDFRHTKETTEGAPERGYIGLQIHGGDDHEMGNKVRFRNVMIKELK